MDNPNLSQRLGLVVGLKKFSESMRHNLQCNICLDYFVDPVTTRCNHQFCRKCILKSLSLVGPRCPICKCSTSKRSLVSKENLTAVVKAVKAIGLEIEGALFSQDIVNHINPGTNQAKKVVPYVKEKNPQLGQVKKLSTKSCPVGPTILTQLENEFDQAEDEQVEVISGSSTMSMAHDGQSNRDSVEVLNGYEDHCHVDDELDSDNLLSASQAVAPEPMAIQGAIFQETCRLQLPVSECTASEKVNKWLSQTEAPMLLVSEDSDEEGGGVDDDNDTGESSMDEGYLPKPRFFKSRKGEHCEGQQPAAEDPANTANPPEKETYDPFRFVSSQKTPPNKRKQRRPSVYRRRMSYSKVDIVRHFKSKAYDPNPTTCKQQQQQQENIQLTNPAAAQPKSTCTEESFPVNVRDRFDEVLMKSPLRQWPTLVNGTKVVRSTSSSASSSTIAFGNLMGTGVKDSTFLFRSPDAVQPLLEKENFGVVHRKRKIIEKRQAGHAETRKRAKVTPAAAGAATTVTQMTAEVIELSPQTVAPINSNIDDVILPVQDSKLVIATPTVDNLSNSVEVVSVVEKSVQVATSRDHNAIGANISMDVDQQQQSANNSTSKQIQTTTSNEGWNCDMAIGRDDQQEEIILTNDNSSELASTKLQSTINSTTNTRSTQSPHPVTNLEIQSSPVTLNNASQRDLDNDRDANPDQEESSNISEEELSFMTRIRLRRAIKAGRTSNKCPKVQFFLRGRLVGHQTLDSTSTTSSVAPKSCQTEKSATKLMTTPNVFCQTEVVQFSTKWSSAAVSKWCQTEFVQFATKASSAAVSKWCQTEVIQSVTPSAVSKLCQTDESAVIVSSTTSRACQTDVIESAKPTSAGSCHECTARRLASATVAVISQNPSELTFADQVVRSPPLNICKQAAGASVVLLADTDIEESMDLIVTKARVSDLPLPHESTSGSEKKASDDHMGSSLVVNENTMDADENNKAADGPATTMESDDCVVQVASEEWGQTQLHPAKMASQEVPTPSTAAPIPELSLHSPEHDKHNLDLLPSNQEDPASSLPILTPEIIIGNLENAAYVSPEPQGPYYCEDLILDANNSLSQPFSEDIFSPSPIQPETTFRRPLTVSSTPILPTSANEPSCQDRPVEAKQLSPSPSFTPRAMMPAWKLRDLRAKVMRMKVNALPSDPDDDDDGQLEEEIDNPERNKSFRKRFKRIHVTDSSDTDVYSQKEKPRAKDKNMSLFSEEDSGTHGHFNDQTTKLVIANTDDLYDYSTPLLPGLHRATHRVIIADDNVDDDDDEDHNEDNSKDNSLTIERIKENARIDLNILNNSKRTSQVTKKSALSLSLSGNRRAAEYRKVKTEQYSDSEPEIVEDEQSRSPDPCKHSSQDTVTFSAENEEDADKETMDISAMTTQFQSTDMSTETQYLDTQACEKLEGEIAAEKAKLKLMEQQLITKKENVKHDDYLPDVGIYDCNTQTKNDISLNSQSIGTPEDPSASSDVLSKVQADLERTAEFESITASGSTAANNQLRKASGDMVFVTSMLSVSQVAKVKRMAAHFNAKLDESFTENTTHVIMKTGDKRLCQRSLKYLMGVARHCFIVSYDWTVKCMEAGRLVLEDDYEVAGDDVNKIHHGPHRSRLSTVPIFKDHDFHCIGVVDGISKDDWFKLLSWSGATYVTHPSLFSYNPNRKSYIIMAQDPTSETDCNKLYLKYRTQVLDQDWVLNSLASYILEPVEKYLQH